MKKALSTSALILFALAILLLVVISASVMPQIGGVTEFIVTTFNLDNDGDPIRDGNTKDTLDDARESLNPLIENFETIAADERRNCFGIIESLDVGVNNVVQLEDTDAGMKVRAGIMEDGSPQWAGVETIDGLSPCIIHGDSETQAFYDRFVPNRIDDSPRQITFDTLSFETSNFMNDPQIGKKVETLTFSGGGNDGQVRVSSGGTYPFVDPPNDNNYVAMKFETNLCFISLNNYDGITGETVLTGSCEDSSEGPWIEKRCLSDNYIHGSLDQEYEEYICGAS